MTEPVLPPQKDLTAIFQALCQADCTIADVVIALLTEKRFKRSPKLAELLQQSGDILKTLLLHTRLPISARKMACEAMQPLYAREIRYLVKSTTGWHFSAHTAVPGDIDDFDLDQLASDTSEHAPLLSGLFSTLLSGRKKLSLTSQIDGTGDVAMGAIDESDGESDSDEDDQAVLEGMVRTPPTSPDRQRQKKANHRERRESLLRIVRGLLTYQ